MEEITYEKALKEEYKNIENYFIQLGNIIIGSCRLIAISLFVTIVITSGIVLLSFTIVDLNSLSELKQYQEFVKTILTCSLLYIFISGIIINLGGVRNIFSENADNKVYRFNKVRDNFEREMDNIDSALLTYGLITEDDIKKRSSK